MLVYLWGEDGQRNLAIFIIDYLELLLHDKRLKKNKIMCTSNLNVDYLNVPPRNVKL